MGTAKQLKPKQHNPRRAAAKISPAKQRSTSANVTNPEPGSQWQHKAPPRQAVRVALRKGSERETENLDVLDAQSTATDGQSARADGAAPAPEGGAAGTPCADAAAMDSSTRGDYGGELRPQRLSSVGVSHG